MRTPFAFLYDVEQRVAEFFPTNPFAARVGFLASFAVIVLFWLAVNTAAQLLEPSSTAAIWLTANWGWLIVATTVIQVSYSFCRLVLETKTITTDDRNGES